MTKWLASVKSLDEAQALTACLPDILDMKNPAQGALGALSVEQVSEIVQWVSGRCQTSATIGDLPMDAGLITTALQSMAQSGVDYLKVGLFASDVVEDCLQALRPTIMTLDRPVIAVIFADQESNSHWLPLIAEAGFRGVMVDTAYKNGLGLLDHWSLSMLQRFVDRSRQHNMLCGLAGALHIEDIERLQPFEADYLGFRSALCEQRLRTQTLQPALARKIQQRLQSRMSLAS